VILAQEFLKNDILCVSSGDASVSLAKYGFLNPRQCEKHCSMAVAALLKNSGKNLPAVIDLGSSENGGVAEFLFALAAAAKTAVRDLPILACYAEANRSAEVAEALALVALGVSTYFWPSLPVTGAPDDGGPLEALRGTIRRPDDRPYRQEDGAAGEGEDDPQRVQPCRGPGRQRSSVDGLEIVIPHPALSRKGRGRTPPPFAEGMEQGTSPLPVREAMQGRGNINKGGTIWHTRADVIFCRSGTDECPRGGASGPGQTDDRSPGPEFKTLAGGLFEGLKGVFKTAGPVMIFASSGTGAWEASLVNTLSPGDKVLMFETGHFATLWKNMALRLGLEVDFVPGTGATAWIRPLSKRSSPGTVAAPSSR